MHVVGEDAPGSNLQDEFVGVELQCLQGRHIDELRALNNPSNILKYYP